MNGKLVVFEGTDGSGKKTQVELLAQYLTTKSIRHEIVDFPRYNRSFFGGLALEMLQGKFGPIEKIPAKLAVLPFANDRWLIKDGINKWLAHGQIVLSNRYTASSAVYHAAKLPQAQQQQFIDWVYELEQEIIKLPKENLVIYFHMPVDVARTLVDKRGRILDMYEKDIELLRSVEELYLSLAHKFSHWKTIQCTRGGSVRRPEEIHKEVLDVFEEQGVL